MASQFPASQTKKLHHRVSLDTTVTVVHLSNVSGALKCQHLGTQQVLCSSMSSASTRVHHGKNKV